MEYKEKYEQALERARKCWGEYNELVGAYENKGICEEIFPELKESEDEKIRKALIHLVNSNKELLFGIDNYDGIKWSDVLAWLEKQGKKDEEILILKDQIESLHAAIIALKEVHKIELKKQGEQKPADKAEPKFHKGDLAVSNLDGKVRQISEVRFDEYNSYYVVDEKSVNLEEYDRLHHLWTIADAKDGDVLSTDVWTFIFKKYQDKFVRYHCAASVFNNFYISDTGEFNFNYVYPATKEQRDTLLKAITDAGYTFDFDKKELKKTEQKPTWSEEDAMFVHGLIRGLAAKRDIHGHTTFSSDCIDITETINWLKSLKDRVQPQPKQEWSEENEEMLNSFLHKLEVCDLLSNKEVIWIKDKFKSLRPQNRWKPSDEQIHWLKWVINRMPIANEAEAVLEELLEQLKKLRE